MIRFAGYEERRKPARTALVQGQRALCNPGQAADAGADHDPGSLALLLLLGHPSGILDRLGRRREREDDKPVHLALVLWRDPVVGIEKAGGGIAARHLRSDSRRQIGNVEGFDRADP